MSHIALDILQLSTTMITELMVKFPDFVVRATNAFNWMSFGFFAFFQLACRAGNVDHFARLVTMTLIPLGILVILLFVFQLLTPTGQKVM